MRINVLLNVVVLMSACTTHARAAESNDARGVIDRAIEAVGGKEVIANHRNLKWQSTGTYYGMGDGFPFTAEYAVSWPDRSRMEISGQLTIVLNGDKGWINSAGSTESMDDDQLAQQIESHHVGWITTLLPLVEEKGFVLKMADKTDVDGQPTVGVRVSKEGHQDVTLYFDEKSGLLVKSVFRGKAPEVGFKEVKAESWFRDYKMIGKMNMPLKLVMHRDGKLFVEGESSKLEPVKSFDKDVFAKP